MIRLTIFPAYAILYLMLCSCYAGHEEDFAVSSDEATDKFGFSDFMLGDDPAIDAGQNDEAVTRRARKENPCAKRNGKVSAICVNFPASAEVMFHQQLKRHNELSYTYQAIANTFARDDYALDGFSKYFEKQSDRKLADARSVYKYILKRGGNINYYDIPRPKKYLVKSPLEAFNRALTDEQHIERMILDLRWYAEDKNDPHLMHFMDGMEETQIDVIKEIGDYIARVKRVLGDGVGIHVLDAELKS